MVTREQAIRHHSPTVWGLVGVGAAFAAEVVIVLGWNAWDRREQLLSRLRI